MKTWTTLPPALALCILGFNGVPAVAQETVGCPQGLPAETTCQRGRDGNGAYYWMATPPNWNGVLVLHAHGGPRLEAPKPDDPVEDLRRFSVTVNEGYAWAGTTYRKPGYGVRLAVEDVEALRLLAIQKIGQPRHIILHGQSWGANVAAKAIEEHPDHYDGALLTSGVLAGGTRAYDPRTDLRAVYEYVCNNHPRPDEPQYPLNVGLPADSKLTPAELRTRVEECTGIGRPEAQRTEAQRSNLRDITTVTTIPEETLVSHLEWATFLYRDIVTRLTGGASPFGNMGVQYRGSRDDAALNANVARLRADPKAVQVLADDSDPTGEVTIPTLTLHAINDPTAFVEGESQYRSVRERAGTAGLLVQAFTRENTHSRLQAPEYAAAFAALVHWIDDRTVPSPSSLAAGCVAAQARYQEACLFDPAYQPKPYDSRVYARDAAK